MSVVEAIMCNWETSTAGSRKQIWSYREIRHSLHRASKAVLRY